MSASNDLLGLILVRHPHLCPLFLRQVFKEVVGLGDDLVSVIGCTLEDLQEIVADGREIQSLFRVRKERLEFAALGHDRLDLSALVDLAPPSRDRASGLRSSKTPRGTMIANEAGACTCDGAKGEDSWVLLCA